MKWIEASSKLRYAPAVVTRDNIIHLDNGGRVDPRPYTEESARRWYFLIEVDGTQLFQVVSMAYNSGWDSWDKEGEALAKYLDGEVELLFQGFFTEFDFDAWNGDWRVIEDALLD